MGWGGRAIDGGGLEGRGQLNGWVVRHLGVWRGRLRVVGRVFGVVDGDDGG